MKKFKFELVGIEKKFARHVQVNFRARSSAVEHRVHIAGVAGSNPAEPKKKVKSQKAKVKINYPC